MSAKEQNGGFLSNLRKRLAKADLSEIARRSGLPRFYLYRVKEGFFTPSIKRADKIWDALDFKIISAMKKEDS